VRKGGVASDDRAELVFGNEPRRPPVPDHQMGAASSAQRRPRPMPSRRGAPLSLSASETARDIGILSVANTHSAVERAR
jgi:hypothetical protein